MCAANYVVLAYNPLPEKSASFAALPQSSDHKILAKQRLNCVISYQAERLETSRRPVDLHYMALNCIHYHDATAKSNVIDYTNDYVHGSGFGCGAATS